MGIGDVTLTETQRVIYEYERAFERSYHRTEHKKKSQSMSEKKRIGVCVQKTSLAMTPCDGNLDPCEAAIDSRKRKKFGLRVQQLRDHRVLHAAGRTSN